MEGIYGIGEEEGEFVKEEEVAGEEEPHIVPHAGGAKEAVVFVYNGKGDRPAGIVATGGCKCFGKLY